jgi:hypothetical protein
MTEWSALVYGRTFVADRWWRALPQGLSQTHWSAKVMLDIVAGGKGLILQRGSAEDKTVFTPRVVLARGPDGTLVGMASRARQLDPQMCTDKSGRELYGFVGWFAADPLTREIPRQAELLSALARWAGAVYREYTGPVWTSPGNSLEVVASNPGSAPWPEVTAQLPGDVASGQPSLLTGSREEVLTWPEADAEPLWDLAVQAGGPFVLTTGWQEARHASLERITHLCAHDVTKATAVPRSVETVLDAETVRDPERAPMGPQPARGAARPADFTTSSRGRQESAGPQPTRDERPDKGKHARRGLLADVWNAITGGTDGSPETSKATGPLTQIDDAKPENANTADAKTTDASDAKTAAGQTTQTADPSVRDPEGGRSVAGPPVDIELPKKSGSMKPFEGLDG